jgi:hypothetical protein
MALPARVPAIRVPVLFITKGVQIQGRVSCADVADFMLRQLTDDTYVRQTPRVSY